MHGHPACGMCRDADAAVPNGAECVRMAHERSHKVYLPEAKQSFAVCRVIVAAGTTSEMTQNIMHFFSSCTHRARCGWLVHPALKLFDDYTTTGGE